MHSHEFKHERKWKRSMQKDRNKKKESIPIKIISFLSLIWLHLTLLKSSSMRDSGG